MRFQSFVLGAGVTASATAGALIAMGRRAGGAALPFVAMGETVTRRASTGGVAAVLTGIGVHVLATVVWALFYLWLADRLNRSVIAAIVAGAVSFVCSWLIARVTGFGLATVLPLGDRLTLAATLAVALMVGMRYARSSTGNVSRAT